MTWRLRHITSEGTAWFGLDAAPRGVVAFDCMPLIQSIVQAGACEALYRQGCWQTAAALMHSIDTFDDGFDIDAVRRVVPWSPACGRPMPGMETL